MKQKTVAIGNVTLIIMVVLTLSVAVMAINTGSTQGQSATLSGLSSPLTQIGTQMNCDSFQSCIEIDSTWKLISSTIDPDGDGANKIWRPTSNGDGEWAVFESLYQQVISSSGSISTVSGSAIATVALQEVMDWGDGTKQESSPERAPALQKYWDILGTSHPYSVAWSAAFVSYVMKTAGVSDFPVSSFHSTYFTSVRDSLTQGSCTTHKMDEASNIKVGDIVCSCRPEGCNVNYESVRSGDEGHCDVVVNKDGGTIEAVGGNRGHSVKKVQIDLSDSKNYGYISCGSEGGSSDGESYSDLSSYSSPSFGQSFNSLQEIFDNYQEDISQASVAFGVEHEFIIAIIMAESAGDASAISPTGCQGLMQVCLNTWNNIYGQIGSEHGLVDNRLDPRSNIFVGTKLLKSTLSSVSNCNEGNDRIKCAIASFNAGAGIINTAASTSDGTWQGVYNVLQNDEFVKNFGSTNPYGDQKYWENSATEEVQRWTDMVSCRGEQMMRRTCKFKLIGEYVNKVFGNYYTFKNPSASQTSSIIVGANNSDTQNKVLLIGDSHTTHDYGTKLQELFMGAGYDTLRYGVGGSTASHWITGSSASSLIQTEKQHNDNILIEKSAGIVPTYDSVQNEFNPDIVVFSLGTNMICDNLDKIEQDTLTLALKANDNEVQCFWVGPALVAEDNNAGSCLYTNLDDAVNYLQVSAEVAGCNYIDAREDFELSQLRTDGYHYTSEGGEELALSVMGEFVKIKLIERFT